MLHTYRALATSAVTRAQFVARTLILPKAGLVVPTQIKPKSVVMLSTPQCLPDAIENAIMLHQMMEIQVIVAGVDAVVPNSVRSGLSELWLDDYCTVSKAVTLAARDAAPKLQESDGIHPVSAKVHWKHVDASLRLQLGGSSVDVALANTAFATNTLATLFYFQPRELALGDPTVGQTLLELHVALPELQPPLLPPQNHDRWTPLTTGQDLTVTKCTGNLIKQINGGPAALVLEKNAELMGIASKDTKVYAKVHTARKSMRYEVIAGGGGWGAKADLLALSPEAKLSGGEKVEFFMVTPEQRYAVGAMSVSRKFLFECTPESTTYGGERPLLQTVEDLFGCGSECGFLLDGVNHRSPGEAVSFSF